VADISKKTWIHGTRKYLRPDTLYCDARYANITQEEINEAKKRIAEREAKNPRPPLELYEKPKYDFLHIKTK